MTDAHSNAPSNAYWGERYLDLATLERRYEELAEAHPEWMRREQITQTRAGHPITLITLTALIDHQGVEASEASLLERPALWIDAGTHAAEWAGIAGALYDLERWIGRLTGAEGTLEEQLAERQWFSQHVIYMIPIICPDGYDALWGGLPYIRSTLRDARGDLVEVGMRTHDIDGDGTARWMRWKHPAGPFVEEADHPGLMRGRRIEDDPSSAYFMCMEGTFACWDEWTWEEAPRPWVEGLDLNRNFPAHWQNFEMFGMDGGPYPLSEVESRAVVDAFAARPRISAALTYHTFTGALLTQPYRKNTPMETADIRLMEAVGKQAVEGTDYRVIRIHPDFVYDENAEVVGVWSDTISSVFGVPGYTLELWDPFKRNGLDNPQPAKFFGDPDPELLRGLIAGFKDTPGAWCDWYTFDHPQLGEVELGGLNFMMTVRNPPEPELRSEVERSHLVAERMRKILPQVNARCTVERLATAGDPAMRQDDHLYRVRLSLENCGFLSTTALRRGAQWSSCPEVSAHLELPGGTSLISGALSSDREHLSGWGEASLGLGGLSPSLPSRGHRALWEWIVQGPADTVLQVRWSGGRGGAGQLAVTLSDDERSLS